MSVKESIKKLQELPENKRRIIFFSIMALIIVGAGILAVYTTMRGVNQLSQSLHSINN